MFKVQRTGSKQFVTGSYGFCVDLAKEAAKQDRETYIISEERGGKWYKIEIITCKYDAYNTAHGYEICKKDGKKVLYLAGISNSEYKWITDFTYSKKYKTFKAAAGIIEELMKGEK